MPLNYIYQPLAVVYISLPYPVTSYYYELVALLPVKRPDVRLASDRLLMILQLLLRLVVEVPERSSQVEASIDPTHVDH